MLSVQFYSDSSLTSMLADFTSRVHPPDGGGFRFSTNAHGFSSLELPLVPLALVEAFAVYDWPGTPHAVVSDHAAGVVWEGRVEDIAIIDGGVSIVALGYQRALWDVPYTALWSKSGSGDWRPVPNSLYSTSRPEQFAIDNNNRVYLSLTKGNAYPNARQAHIGYQTPHNGERDITNISLDYSVTLPTNWLFRVRQADGAAWSPGGNTTIVTGNGSNQTGSYSLTLSTPREGVALFLDNATGTTSTITDETGTWFARATNIRIKTTTASTVLASDIAAALATFVNGVNSSQLSAADELITATATDLQDELYEDLYPAEILDRLALLHDYEWGVWENRRLHFRQRGSAGRSWYIDVTSITDLQRSLERVRNSAYSVYRDANGRTQRTSAASNAASLGRFGITRRGVVSVQSTSQTEAETHRATFLADRADASARADVRFARLYDEAGAEYPLYALRAGDMVTMRNLSPSLSATVDRIRSFVVAETMYDAATGEMDVTPEEPTPTLERLVAQREAGL